MRGRSRLALIAVALLALGLAVRRVLPPSGAIRLVDEVVVDEPRCDPRFRGDSGDRCAGVARWFGRLYRRFV
jgi:hypothetical protein